MKGCLLLHGFTGSPHEVWPLAEHLRQTTDWQIHTPTLPGHGRGESLRKVNWEDWKKFAERECESMLQHCEQLSVIGFSMGGFIAAHLSVIYPLQRVVIMSAPVFTLQPRRMLEDMLALIKHPQHVNGTLKAEWKRYRQKIKHTPLRAVCQFRKLVLECKPAIDNVHIPTLIIHGQKDSLAQPRSAQYIYEHVPATVKDLLYLPGSRHLICHDVEKEKMFATVVEFIQTEKEVYV